MGFLIPRERDVPFLGGGGEARGGEGTFISRFGSFSAQQITEMSRGVLCCSANVSKPRPVQLVSLYLLLYLCNCKPLDDRLTVSLSLSTTESLAESKSSKLGIVEGGPPL